MHITDWAGQLQRTYVYTDNAHMFGEVLVQNSPYPNEVISDIRGTPVLTISSSGQIQQPSNFDPYGVPADPSTVTQFGFAGCLWDSDTGLCHFGVRDYVPAFERWLQ